MLNKNKEKIFLDVVNDKCPMPFVKTKIALETLDKNQNLIVHISDGESLKGIPNALQELGYKIINKKKLEKGIYSLEINAKLSNS